MKASEVRALDKQSRKDKIIALKKEHFNIRFKMSAGDVSGVHRLKQIKRDIARIKTIESEE